MNNNHDKIKCMKENIIKVVLDLLAVIAVFTNWSYRDFENYCHQNQDECQVT